jgi:hypothetical protein
MRSIMVWLASTSIFFRCNAVTNIRNFSEEVGLVLPEHQLPWKKLPHILAANGFILVHLPSVLQHPAHQGEDKGNKGIAAMTIEDQNRMFAQIWLGQRQRTRFLKYDGDIRGM